MKRMNYFLLQALMTCCFSMLMIPALAQELSTTQAPAVPSGRELNRPFGDYDREAFQSPPKVYYPEIWFHYIGGNVSLKGITADLEAIARSGISGIQLFHGQFGGPWPGCPVCRIYRSPFRK